MQNLKKGDIIVAEGVREIVLARLEDLVFLQRLFDNGTKGPVQNAIEIADLIAYGYKVEL